MTNPTSSAPAVPASLRALLAGLVDYAGTFPPAKLDLERAARNFVKSWRSPHSWMLGRMVVPATQIEQLEALFASMPEMQMGFCPLTVLLGADPLKEVALVLDRFQQTGSRSLIETVEVRPATIALIAELDAVLPEELEVYCEVSPGEAMDSWLDAVRQAGWSAKIRTGGITAEMFPSSLDLAVFMMQCKERGVAFKATAGLHHPVRAQHPLTYEANSVCGVMHGFLNVFIAAALVTRGLETARTAAILDDRDPTSFTFTDDFASWRGQPIPTEELMLARRYFAHSFGSCSFDEPVGDLKKLGLL